MPANFCCCALQLLGTLRFVRRWVTIGRVLQRAQRELWAIAVLMLLLLLICTHLGNMVRTTTVSLRNTFWGLTWLCFWSSFFFSQLRVSCQWRKAGSQWCPCFVTRGYSKNSARTTQSWDHSMDYLCLAAAFGCWLDSVEQLSSLHIGILLLWLHVGKTFFRVFLAKKLNTGLFVLPNTVMPSIIGRI